MAAFNTRLRDSQSSSTPAITPEQFDCAAYADYEAALLERCRHFAVAPEGLLVYRRFRADGVFFSLCRDRETSLALQLGALQASMAYAADVPNFLEPWYGIGYIAASFGSDYIWPQGQAPAVQPRFSSCAEILSADHKSIANTSIGQASLDMIDYFLTKTHGMLPISFSDIQSPLNMLSYLLPLDDLFLELLEEPETVSAAAALVTDLLLEFLQKQREMIGACLAQPGHGFASCRAFSGVGLSDDISLMISSSTYADIFQPQDERLGAALGGTVYHSCGNWAQKIELVKRFAHLSMVDGAFTAETDPSPNDPSAFAGKFTNTGIVLNARAVGSADTAYDALNRLWQPGQKLIAVTYCQSPEEQSALYRRLHKLAE